MNPSSVRIGMIGYQFMGKAHSHAYRDLPFYFDPPVTPVLQAVSGRNEEKVKQAAEKLGWQSYETDWRRLIEREDIDMIDIVTPNHTHAEMAVAAAEAGKHILCEKPLALTVEQAERMHEAAEKNAIVHMIAHNYRFAPAVAYAKKLISEGRLGEINHVRAQYLQDWLVDPEAPLVWRLSKDISGSGTLGDIGSHSIDLARYLVGEITELVSTMKTFVKERPLAESSAGLSGKANEEKKGEVEVDDAAAFLATFENGALGVFEATRYAGGNRNGNRIEINGSKGSLRWDMENMNHLEVYFENDEPGLQGFRTIHCTEEDHPYAGNYWPAGHMIGYEHTFIHLVYEMMKGIHSGSAPVPNFRDGVINQRLLAAIEQSHQTRQWVKTGGGEHETN
ncbi:Gfo/Idh/MocA family protein [Salibacterium aidingense]|uniref:Gfo/Idh/MocA family protein n=1 Tax=Salibacterium aidingense TaxID=384933 RepID=UPI003BE0149C